MRESHLQVYLRTHFQTQNSVYEVLSDVNSRQDIMDERIASMEDRMNSIQCSLDVLPDILTRCLVKQLEIFQQQQGSSSHSGQGPGGGGGQQQQQQQQQGQRRILMTQGVNSNPPSTSSAALALSAGSGDSSGPAATVAASAVAPPAPPYSEVDFSTSFADNFVRNRGQAAAAANPVQGSRSSANPSPGTRDFKSNQVRH